MNVTELNAEQLEQLKWNYFYAEEVEHSFDSPFQIPDKVIFEHFSNTAFVEEDF